jgi:hypothetical protein
MAAPSPAARALLDQANVRWPNRRKASDGIMPSAAHTKANPVSDHETGCAADLTHDPARGVDCAAIFEAMRVSRDPRIKYAIHNGRMFSSTIRPYQVRPYTGSNRHTGHIHVSINYARRGDASAWPGIASVVVPAPAPAPAPTTLAPNQRRVTSNCYMRKGPSLLALPVISLRAGYVVTFLGVNGSGNGLWSKVQLGRLVGWTMNKKLTK